MRRFLALCSAGVLATLAIWAGGMTIEVANPKASPEAAALQAALVARVVACHDPAKSTVTAEVVHQQAGGNVVRTPLQVTGMQAPGMFAIRGDVPAGSVVELAVTSPDYPNYRPRVLLRTGAAGVEWGSVKRFYGTPPTDADVKHLLLAAASTTTE